MNTSHRKPTKIKSNQIERLILDKISQLPTKNDIRQMLSEIVEKFDRIQPIVQLGFERIAMIGVEVGKIRGKVFSRSRIPSEVVDKCFEYWTLGRNNATIRKCLKKKVTYENVFNYYSAELRTMGVESVEDFKRALGARNDRDRRRIGKKLPRQGE